MQRYTKLAILLVLTALFTLGGCAENTGPGPKPPRGFFMRSTPRPVPESSLTDQKGDVVHLSAFKGRVVLIDVWATWCVPCRIELPMLESLQKLLGPEGLTVLPIAVDKDTADVVTLYHQNNLHALPLVFDPAFTTAESLHASVLPTAILVNREGQEIGRVVGGHSWTKADVIAFLRALLKKP